MTDYLPKFKGSPITFTASTPVTGGRLVAVTGARLVGPAGDNAAAVVGVAGYDVDAGGQVIVYTRPGGIHPLVAAGTIAVGAKVCAASGGRVRTAIAGENTIGTTITSATDGARVEVQF